MEEKSIIHQNEFQSSLSEWKIRHNIYQTNRNFNQLQNRLAILELQKKKKLKDIQNKLYKHKRFVQNKIYKYQLKSSIEHVQDDQLMRQTSNSRAFQSIKDSRNMSIKRKQQQMRTTKQKLFQQVKKTKQENQILIRQSRLQCLQHNANKRNKVRLLQIGCKQNIYNYWSNRLENFQQDKRHQMYKKIKIHQTNLNRLQYLQLKQESLLEEIKRTDQVQEQLIGLIQNQKSMDGGKLDHLYYSKIGNYQSQKTLIDQSA